MMQYAIAESTPWFADFVNLIEEDDSILFWHCGNAPYDLSDEKPKIEKVFGGPAQTAVLKKGIATVARINSIRGTYSIHAGVGEVVEGKSYLKGSNLFIKMNGGNMRFVESLLYNGIPHHNSIVYGDILEEIKEFANLMDIPIVVV
jgi:L-fucose isomerase-like protein